jgi:DNA ligase-1
VDRAFDDARERRNEGLMVKDPASTYQPGRRGLGWLKLKKALATLDCVVVGVEWGHGKRRSVLSDYTFAVREADAPDARLLTIGKAYTGLTDAEIATMTERFTALTLQDFGRYRTVVPEVVVEIAFDRIMRSSRHRSGFALRFPRIARIRDDKTAAEADTLATVDMLVTEQASGRILLATGASGETEHIAATGDGPEG